MGWDWKKKPCLIMACYDFADFQDGNDTNISGKLIGGKAIFRQLLEFQSFPVCQMLWLVSILESKGTRTRVIYTPPTIHTAKMRQFFFLSSICEKIYRPCELTYPIKSNF